MCIVFSHFKVKDKYGKYYKLKREIPPISCSLEIDCNRLEIVSVTQEDKNWRLKSDDWLMKHN